MSARRMFSSKVVRTDNFLAMPKDTQYLYIQLLLEADDDGFITNAKSTMKTLECTEDDLALLIAKNYLISFPSGIVLVKHWNVLNTIRKDRYRSSTLSERHLVTLGKDKEYYLVDSCNSDGSQMVPSWYTKKCQAGIPDGNQPDTDLGPMWDEDDGEMD